MAKKISQFSKKTILNNDDLILTCTNQGVNGIEQASSMSTLSNKVSDILEISNYAKKNDICSTLNQELVNAANVSSLTLPASTARQQSDNTSLFKTVQFNGAFPTGLQNSRFYIIQLSYNLEPNNLETSSTSISNFNSYLRFNVNSVNMDVGLKNFTLKTHAPRHFCQSYLIQKDLNSKFLGASDTNAELMIIHDSIAMQYEASFKLEIISSFSHN